MSEDLDRLVTREATLTPIVISFCPLEIFPEAESNAKELFDKCRNIEGVKTDRCSVSDCRGPDVSFKENNEDFCSSWEELVDFKDAIFCVSVIVPAMFVDVRSLSCRVPSAGEYAITGVFDVESFVDRYPVTLLSLTAYVFVDNWLDEYF